MGSWALPLVLVAERCRTETRQRFGTAWTKQKAQIEEKYRRILEEFEVRCRASLT